MAIPEHIRAQRYRERKAAKLARAGRIEAALVEIDRMLEGNNKPLAAIIRSIAQKALKEEGKP